MKTTITLAALLLATPAFAQARREPQSDMAEAQAQLASRPFTVRDRIVCEDTAEAMARCAQLYCRSVRSTRTPPSLEGTALSYERHPRDPTGRQHLRIITEITCAPYAGDRDHVRLQPSNRQSEPQRP